MKTKLSALSLAASARAALVCLHLNHPAGDQVGPHEPAGDHLHELDVPLLRRLLWMLSASGFPGPPSQGPRVPQSLCLPGSPKSGAHLWVQQQQHVQTGVAAAALLLTSFVRPPVTARPPQHSQALAVGAAGGGCQGWISKLPGVDTKSQSSQKSPPFLA